MGTGSGHWPGSMRRGTLGTSGLDVHHWLETGSILGPYPNLLPRTVINTITKSNWWRKGFIWFTCLHHRQSMTDVRAITQTESDRDHGGVLLIGWLPKVCSTCFLIAPWTTCPGVTPPTMAWAPPPSVTNLGNT